MQLQTDFEMTWDVPVKEITFTQPGQPAVAQPVKMMIGGVQRTLSKLTDFAPAGMTTWTNCGPKALPLVELITATPAGAPQLPVWVTITYRLQPKLKTVVCHAVLREPELQGAGGGRGCGLHRRPRFWPAHRGRSQV